MSARANIEWRGPRVVPSILWVVISPLLALHLAQCATAFAEGWPSGAPRGRAAQDESHGPTRPGCLAPPTVRSYLFHSYPLRLWGTTREAYSGWSLVTLALAGGAVPVVDDYDGEARSEIREHRPRHGIVEAGEILGSPASLFGTSLGIVATGCLGGSDELVATGATLLEGLSVTGASTIALKLSVHRRRPDGSDHLSFPSNHASGSFAVASVLARRHGWHLGVPAFLAAGFVSWARVAADKHFLSDTLFGAALGTAVGLAVARAREQHRETTLKGGLDDAAEPTGSLGMAVIPVLLAGGGGVAVEARW